MVEQGFLIAQKQSKSNEPEPELEHDYECLGWMIVHTWKKIWNHGRCAASGTPIQNKVLS